MHRIGVDASRTSAGSVVAGARASAPLSPPTSAYLIVCLCICVCLCDLCSSVILCSSESLCHCPSVTQQSSLSLGRCRSLHSLYYCFHSLYYCFFFFVECCHAPRVQPTPCKFFPLFRPAPAPLCFSLAHSFAARGPYRCPIVVAVYVPLANYLISDLLSAVPSVSSTQTRFDCGARRV
jgi:hypothetical protein